METLEPVWNGALERSGAVAGLSRYQGRSSIYHSPSYEFLDGAEHREVAALKPRRVRGAAQGRFDEQALELLRKGMSYGGIAKVLGCSTTVPRRLARVHGLCRREASSARPSMWGLL